VEGGELADIRIWYSGASLRESAEPRLIWPNWTSWLLLSREKQCDRDRKTQKIQDFRTFALYHPVSSLFSRPCGTMTLGVGRMTR
jgi:hypothetical protein